FKTLSSREIQQSLDSDTLYLQENETSKGSIEVKITGQDGKQISAQVKLMTKTGQELQSQNADLGFLRFDEIETGEYYAIVSNDSENYATQTSETKRVTKNGTTKFEVKLEKNIIGRINATIKDANSGLALGNAIVKLLKEKNGTAIQATSSDAEGKAHFNVTDAGTYFVQTLLGENYLYSLDEVLIDSGEKELPVKLAKATPLNSGKIEITVKDEEGLAVESAEVFVYDGITDFLLPLQSQITDANGIVKFSGLKDGTYYARAVKAKVEGVSTKKKIDIREETKFNVDLKRGQGILELEVTDLEGKPIPTPRIELNIVGAQGANEILGSPEGKTTRNIKAGSQVYVRVTKEGYSSFISQAVTIVAGETSSIKAELDKTIPGTNPSIEFLGLFETDSSDKAVEEIGSGKNYFARFKITIPEEAKNLQNVNVFIRTGKTELLEKDSVFIKEVIAPNALVKKY
ncbi:MAG: hypothetical protein Q7K42_02540, partial [Candidatus Diapherotrites archaeon]|nr:hypothetical protein [Candidatus Diapherotrites archaeon]